MNRKAQRPRLKPVRPGMIPFWMLNDGSTVSEKIAYMRACRSGGIEALALHPRSGNQVPYASREWFSMIRALVEEGRRLRMDIWLYDEDPFPSGAAGGGVMAARPDLKARGMQPVTAPPGIRTGSLWRISEHPVLWAGLVSEHPPRRAHNLTDAVGPVRSEWFMTPWNSRYYYEDTPLISCPRGDAVNPVYALRVPEIPDGFRLEAVALVPSGTDSPWGSLPDLLNPDAFGCFRDLVLDRYRREVGMHFGRTIPGIFTDEAKPNGAWPVTRDLWTDFRKRFGYDLRPRLFRLFGEPADRKDLQVRLDYRRWVLDRFLDAFVRPYRRYCDQAGLRLVGHFSPEDDPVAEAPALGSVMPIMRAMSGPGTDLIVPLVGDASAPALNLGSLRASSIRACHETGICISESLGLSGWAVTTHRARQILAWQKTLGIDRFFIHGFYQSSEGVQNYEAPPDFGPNSSIFDGMGVLNDWLRRLETRMDGTEDDAPVAVLNSLYAYWITAGTENMRCRQLRKAYWKTLLNLLSAQVGIHLVDESEFGDGIRVSDGHFSLGARRYRILLAPANDILGGTTLEAMRRMAAGGVRVVHFGGGARDVLPECGALRRIRSLPGECRRALWPSATWCRRELPRAVAASGTAARSLRVRRFRDRQGHDRLLAANLAPTPCSFRLAAPQAGEIWLPEEVDGQTRISPNGTLWNAPAGGCGWFRKENAPPSERHPDSPDIRARTLPVPAFRRLDPNTARLNRMTASWPGLSIPRTLPYPQPYWRISDAYRATREWETFGGRLPIESTPAHDRLAYSVEFSVADDLTRPLTLLLDPRCARGTCSISLNGRILRKTVVFPLEGTRPLRLPLGRALRTGANRLDVTFRLSSALDGLLSQLYLEGDFDLHLEPDGGLSLCAPHSSHHAGGWQLAGMPHYMGRGRYEWTQTLDPGECRSDGTWTLELDAVTDSAECVVNGRSMGRRAWPPWRWDLSGLRPGENTITLSVSGTAGNRHSLDGAIHAQGWIGGGRLVHAPISIQEALAKPPLQAPAREDARPSRGLMRLP